MQKINKYVQMVACLVMVVIALCGCDSAAAPLPTATPRPTPTEPPKKVVLVMGGWRISAERMNRVLAAFHEKHPHITVCFDPTLSGEYDEVLLAQLKAGTAPDVFYLRSFAASRALFEQGYLEPLTGLPGLTENFAPDRLVPWTAEDGTPYGVPFTASSHGIYYNKTLFEELGLAAPESWEALLATAQTIEAAGYIPFANGSKDSWAVAEIIFMNLAPNFVGGRQGRLAYLSGERCFNDEHIVSTFQAVADLAPYFSEDHPLLGYVDSLQMFVQGKALMWMSGSWDIPYFETEAPDFEWDVFAIPPPAGRPAYLTFHLDVGIGLNAASGRQDEAKEFLAWMTTPEFGALLGNEMPGFFPMHREVPPLMNKYANTFLSLNQGRGTDIRFVSERVGNGSPAGYTLIQNETKAVLEGKHSPQESADALQAGLAEWFEPAQHCKER